MSLSPAALQNGVFCLHEFSKDVEGEVFVLDADRENCPTLGCDSLTVVQFLRLRLTRADCDSPFGNILDAANALIVNNTRRLGKNLRTEAGPGEPVRVYESTSDYAEAQWLVEEAQQLHREGMRRSEIAFLYRSNAQSRAIESAL